MRTYNSLFQWGLFTLFAYLCHSSLCFATGPSWVKIQIVPITYNDYGILLCKTRYSINYTGAQTLMGTEYGWLVVSVDGIWEEHLHQYFDAELFQSDNQNVMKAFNLQENEFSSPFNWNSPPTSVQPILKKYNFQKRDMNITYDKATILSLIKDMLKTCNECEKRQRSLHNLTAMLTEKDILDIAFYHAGVIFLKNIHDESQHIGGVFDVPHFMTLQDKIPRDYGIEMQYIDGILLLPQQ